MNDFNVDERKLWLRLINSATKYPSIDTHHVLGERGILTDKSVSYEGRRVVITEKVDGTNARIIQLPGGDWLVGSREHLLTARGDRVPNPQLGIVDAVSDLTESAILPVIPDGERVFRTIYLEVYGHQVGKAAQQYTTTGAVGYRVFDIAVTPFTVLKQSLEEVSRWRDDFGPLFHTETQLRSFSETTGIPLTPRIDVVDGDTMPTSIEDMASYLEVLVPRTRVALDEGAGLAAEGVVFRDEDRSIISKARFEDYARTLRKRGKIASKG